MYFPCVARATHNERQKVGEKCFETECVLVTKISKRSFKFREILLEGVENCHSLIDLLPTNIFLR